MDGPLETLKPITTRIYNTKKTKWSEFKTVFKSSLTAHDINANTVERVETVEDLELMVDAYQNSVRDTCEVFIPKKAIWKGKARPPWWSKELEDLKRDVLRKKRRIKKRGSDAERVCR